MNSFSTATTEVLDNEDAFYSPAAHYFVSYSGKDGYDVINTGNEGPVIVTASGKSSDKLSLPPTMSFSPQLVDFFLPGTTVINGEKETEGESKKSFGIQFTKGLALVMTENIHAFKPLAPMVNIYDSPMYPAEPMIEDEKGNFYILSGKTVYAVSNTDIKQMDLSLDEIRDLKYDPELSFQSNFMVAAIETPVTRMKKEMFAEFATAIVRKL